MTLEGALRGLAGGALIGLAAALALLVHGRIAGISGILGRGLRDLSLALRPGPAATSSGARFRWPFLAGLIATGALASLISPSAIGSAPRGLPSSHFVRSLAATADGSLPRGGSLTVLAVAGLLVGFGATLANGCTSGHGVCGIARWSRRSLVAVLTFMSTAAITVALVGAGS